MGLYIPGGSSSGDSSSTATPPPNQPSRPASSSSSSSSASTSGSALTINGITYYPRPSIGLSAWGLLKPSPDNSIAVSLLVSSQTILGLTLLRNLRLQWRSTGLLSKAFHGFIGSWLLYQTGLALSGMILPWDPWVEEARMSRMRLPNAKKDWREWWFGDLTYRFMPLEQWEHQVGHWIEITEEMETEYAKICGEFAKVSHSIKQMETARDSKILEELRLLGDDWKFAKLPAHQEKNRSDTSNLITGKPGPVVPEQLDSFIHDEDSLVLSEIRELNDPWKAMKEDTEYMIRFVPRFRWLQERSEFTQGRMTSSSEEDQKESN